MSMSILNTFCRNYDLIFVETCTERGQETYLFLDFKNRRVRYSADEIRRRLANE